MKYILFAILITVTALVSATSKPEIKLSDNQKGLGYLSYQKAANGRNYINDRSYLGEFMLKYSSGDVVRTVKLADVKSRVLNNDTYKIEISWFLPENIEFTQSFKVVENEIDWNIDIRN
ncbi:hypothetical protein [Dysgonomonas termitidis]|uniref:Uncharacterized protein n=1 Tax=Dysgonomonas termitidis TaxID=1516126 RepID=A0ABV9L3D6_9BACT